MRHQLYDFCGTVRWLHAPAKLLRTTPRRSCCSPVCHLGVTIKSVYCHYELALRALLLASQSKVRARLASRATAEAHFWHDYPEVLAGRDLVNHGTWLGVTLSGRFALLTNFREARLDFRIRAKERRCMRRCVAALPGLLAARS